MKHSPAHPVFYRLGAVPYLNGKPLVYDLHLNPRPHLLLEEAVPAQLVEKLRKGELDAALVSSIACLDDGMLYALARPGIAAYGPIDSVRLFCRESPQRLRRVALDSSSRTAAALTRILLRECFGIQPEYFSAPPDLGTMLEKADAALLIGDPALRAYYAGGNLFQGLVVLDPGELWKQLTGLPFVYAVWAIRPEVPPEPLLKVLQEARDAARPHISAIVESAANRLGIPVAVCRRYLTEVMIYDLGPREWEGLWKFQKMAKTHGLVPQDAPPVTVVGMETNGS